MKKSLALILAFTIISTLNFCKKSDPAKYQTVDYKTTQEGISANAKIIKQKLGSKYNPEVAFLVDMRIPSNKYRFFVYNLRNDKILDRGMVAHGSGSETGVPGKLKFSNIENSLMTSIGTYSIGKSYSGQFGKPINSTVWRIPTAMPTKGRLFCINIPKCLSRTPKLRFA